MLKLFNPAPSAPERGRQGSNPAVPQPLRSHQLDATPDRQDSERKLTLFRRVFTLTIWRHCEDMWRYSRHLGRSRKQRFASRFGFQLIESLPKCPGKFLGRNKWIQTMPFWENCCRVKICEGLAWPLKTSPTGSFRRLHLTNTGVFHQPVQTFCKACDMSVLALFWIMALAVTACKKAFKPSSSWKPCPSAARYKRDIANALRIVGETHFFEKWKSWMTE